MDMTETQETQDLSYEMIELLAIHGFLPAEVDASDELNDVQAKTVSYYAGKGWDAFRTEGNGGLTLVRWTDEINLLSLTEYGVVKSSATFGLNRQGMEWLVGAVR